MHAPVRVHQQQMIEMASSERYTGAVYRSIRRQCSRCGDHVSVNGLLEFDTMHSYGAKQIAQNDDAQRTVFLFSDHAGGCATPSELKQRLTNAAVRLEHPWLATHQQPHRRPAHPGVSGHAGENGFALFDFVAPHHFSISFTRATSSCVENGLVI